MQGVLAFDSDRHVTKRHKAVRACQRCKDSKKRCSLTNDLRRCKRCDADGWPCSFERTPQPSLHETQHQRQHVSSEHGRISPLSVTTLPPYSGADTRAPIEQQHSAGWTNGNALNPVALSTRNSFYSGSDGPEHHEYRTQVSMPMEPLLSSTLSPDDRDSRSNLRPPSPLATPVTCASKETEEFRYATMLSLMEARDSSNVRSSPRQAVKLISGTNPLSALLGKELKHTIVTNSCSFRTPDPVSGASKPSLRRGPRIHSFDWEQYYRVRGVPATRLQFLHAMGCFRLPPAARCAELLEIFFTYIHPMLPVIDRKDFLSCYYGSGEPPPLLVLHAVFLAASRYMNGEGRSVDGVPEIRSHCDELHAKLRSLIDVDISQERLAVIQASLIASLHWEGREGLNSAIDSLSLAVRACQEMGLHRKMVPAQRVTSKAGGQDLLYRRIWWSAYTLDRLCAAQEGTPFLINEGDCDVELLTEDDLASEDSVTVQATLINLSIARLIEDVVRCLYSPQEDHTTLFTSRGVRLRQRLAIQLEDLKSRVQNMLLSGQEVEDALKEVPYTVSILCGAILLTHIDAVQILVHRPFLLYSEPHESDTYFSRDACRRHSVDILSRLNLLLRHNLLRFSWPFTVYAVVNCLLIFWYDVSSPSPMAQTTLQAARRDYSAVVNLLRVMGNTWWAAAAKHKLALALARAADMLHAKERQNAATPTAAAQGGSAVSITALCSMSTDISASAGYEVPPSPLSRMASGPYDDGSGHFDNDVFFECDSTEYWSSLGLDFNLDVADNIFSIERLGSVI